LIILEKNEGKVSKLIFKPEKKLRLKIIKMKMPDVLSNGILTVTIPKKIIIKHIIVAFH
jgi:hypothetical protein